MATRKTTKAKAEPTPEPAEKPAKAKAAPKAAPKPKKAAEATPLLPEAVAEAPAKAPKKPAKAAKAEAPTPEPEPKAEPRPKKAPKAQEPAAPAISTAQHQESILAAMREGRAVEFIFSDPDANPPRTFEPRQLVFDALAQAWFVWGWDRRYNAERHHRLDALAEVNAVEGVGRSAQGPYKEGTPANQIGGWLGGEPIAVKATLMKQWIFAVRQAPPAFPDFKLVDAEDGKASVSFTATDLRAIARWCMQFGDGIQVQEPQRLVDRIKQVGLAWGGKPAAAPAPAPAPKPRPEEPKREARHEEPRREARHEHRREERKEHREEPKAKGPKVEVRVERL